MTFSDFVYIILMWRRRRRKAGRGEGLALSFPYTIVIIGTDAFLKGRFAAKEKWAK